MTVTFRPAPAVKRIASELIAKHHQHLDDIRIEYVFRSDALRRQVDRASVERDVVRRLNPDEARALAAMLRHYADEVER